MDRVTYRVGDVSVDMLAYGGLVAMRGRTQPALLQAMIGKKCAFLHASSTVVHSRDPGLLEAMTTGRAFLNGLAGEGWTRLIGDRFE